MQADDLKITRRRLPHWSKTGSTYFITFRVQVTPLSHAERLLVLEHIRGGQDKFYKLAAVVVMPDHVHLILKPMDGLTLSRIMKGIKGVSANRLNQLRHTSGAFWQAESFDRILRNEQEFEEKLQYMLDNPVKAGLAATGWEYDGWYFNPDFN